MFKMKTSYLQFFFIIGSAFGVQSAFAQSPYNTVSGRVWKEQGTVNNLRDAGEPGVTGIMVTMMDAVSGLTVANALTDTNGLYTINNYQGTGEYVLQFDYPGAGYTLTQKRVGSDNDINSSADPSTGQTDPFTISTSANVTNFGLGLVSQANTITYAATRLFSITDWNFSFALPKSDSSFGVLTKATIYINCTEWHPYFGVENTSASAASTSPSSGIQVSVTPPVGSAINAINAIPHLNTSLGAYDGTTDYTGLSGRSWDNEFASVIAPARVITLASQLNPFRGTGNVSFPTTALSTVTLTGGGNLLSQISTFVGTSVSIVYEYAGGILPVTMPTFTATASASTVNLKWETTSEKNNAFFAIERSMDGKTYHTVGKVGTQAENGNSNTLLGYQFTDYNVPDGQIFYRLRQTDIDGTAHYSGIRVVRIGQGSGINIYPNPANEIVYLEAGAGATLTIVDLNGKVQKQVACNASGVQRIDTRGLSTGTYIIRLQSGNEVDYQRFTILR